MIEGEHLSMSQAAALLPHKPSPATVWRWCTKGTRAKDGTKVVLQCVQFGRRIFTKPEWIQQYGDELAKHNKLAGEPRTVSSKTDVDALCIQEGL